MLILDTDHLSILDRGGVESRALRARLARRRPDEVVTTIINFEEQMRGWLAYVARVRSVEQQREAYLRLRRHLDNYRILGVLDFDNRAIAHFTQLQKSRIRIGSMDLKIAAIALALDATLLTRNLADFRKVPALKLEDWTL